MEQRPFPKPERIKPFPEKSWLRRTDRAESSREPFFFGRDAEYEIFRSALESLREGFVGGGSMIYLGAPGAGKSALKRECIETVRQHSTPEETWVAVSIDPSDLKSPAHVISALIHAADEESKRLDQIAPNQGSQKLKDMLKLGKQMLDELSARGLSVAGVSFGGKTYAENLSDKNISAAEIFREAAAMFENIHFVVFVDEAQTVPVGGMTTAVIHCLHHDTHGISLVAAFFGLSNAQEILRKCGLSTRLGRGRICNLESLSMREATGSFQCMLDAYYTGNTEDKNLWASELAKLSQGWPQHINAIGVAAGLVIRANGGKLEQQLLEKALKKGVDQKNDYYDQRLGAGYRNTKLYVELAVAAAAANAHGELDIDELQDIVALELERNGISFDDFLHQSLLAGVLAPAKGPLRRYKFPIPSLRDYLCSQSAASSETQSSASYSAS